MQYSDEIPSFEKAPGDIETKTERDIPPEQNFADSFAEGVPEFAGEKFGVAHEDNEYYGEAPVDLSESDEGITDAASLLNYGLDAAARERGVESVVQGIKSFDPSGHDNVLRALFEHLGIDTPEEFKDVHEESTATSLYRSQFQDEHNLQKTERKSQEGLLKAIADMKELISEVEGADPRYNTLRDAAKTDQIGYFDEAVKSYNTRGLTELFSALAEQKEQPATTETDGTLADNSTNPNNSENSKSIDNEPIELNKEIIS